jgi:hypothetical protein
MTTQILRAPVLISEGAFDPIVAVFAPKSEVKNISHIATEAGSVGVNTSTESLGNNGNPLKEVVCLFRDESEFGGFYHRLSRAGYTVIIPT